MNKKNVYIIAGPKRLTVLDKAELAMKQAVKKVIAQHKKEGLPLVIWGNGKVKKVAAE